MIHAKSGTRSSADYPPMTVATVIHLWRKPRPTTPNPRRDNARLRALRRRAFKFQRGLCYYCGLPMWLGSPKLFARAYRMPLKKAGQFRCTAEHLQPRCNGGPATRDNIVAACVHCNMGRHEEKPVVTPAQWRIVQKAEAQQRWGHAATRARIKRSDSSQGCLFPAVVFSSTPLDIEISELHPKPGVGTPVHRPNAPRTPSPESW